MDLIDYRLEEGARGWFLLQSDVSGRGGENKDLFVIAVRIGEEKKEAFPFGAHAIL